jgi:hypothetical protein
MAATRCEIEVLHNMYIRKQDSTENLVYKSTGSIIDVSLASLLVACLFYAHNTHDCVAFTRNYLLEKTDNVMAKSACTSIRIRISACYIYWTLHCCE